jgi:hypothetical protein
VTPADQVLARYRRDGKDADAAYKGKTLEVVGRVELVKKDATKVYYVEFASPEAGTIAALRCYLGDRQPADPASVARGREVRIRGVCRGRSHHLVVLDQCEIVSRPGRSP